MNTSTSITNGVIHGQENNNTNSIQNPERVKSKGRQKKRKRYPTIVEAAKEKAKKKKSATTTKKKYQVQKKKTKGYNKTR